MYALNFDMVTSQNTGVFLGGKIVIDCETFERILRSSKGGILYVPSRVKKEELMKASLKCSKIYHQKAQMGSYVVTFPFIGIHSLLQI